MSKKVKLHRHQCLTRAEFQPSSYDEKSRTVEIVWSTGSRVKRYDWGRDQYYWEELSMDPKAIRMERMQNGAPFLNNHSNWDLRDVIGVVERAEVKGGVGHATIRFSKRDDVKEIVDEVKDGILRHVSVGYKVHKIERTQERIDDIAIYRVVDWEPLEVSLVTIPADAKSQVRGEENDFIECEIINPEENDMGKRANQATPEGEAQTRSEATPSETEASAAPAQAEQTDAGQSTQAEGEQPSGDQPQGERSETPSTPAQTTSAPSADEVRAQEIARQQEIRTAVRLAGLEESVADEFVGNAKMTADDARKEIFKRLEAKQPTTNNQRFEVKDMDTKQLRKEAAVRAILHRADPTKYEMKNGDSEIGRGSLIDMARNFLHMEGVRDAYSMSKNEVAKRALHHSSDFAEVLANVSNKSLADGYAEAPGTFDPFVKAKSVSDFKEITSVEVSNGGSLEKVRESGEYKRTTLKESAEKYKVEKFGLIIGKTWELMVNDDLGAFTDIPGKLGRRARELENETFWNMILSNPVMAETGEALFSAAHGNKQNTTAIAIASLGVAREKMRLMKDLDGKKLAGITPSYLVVPAALETLAEQFITQVTPNENGKVNPFANKLKLITEPLLDASSASAWYVMADKMKVAMAEMARLDGKGPEIFVREGFDVDGMEVKIRYVFGMKVLNYRGFFRTLT